MASETIHHRALGAAGLPLAGGERRTVSRTGCRAALHWTRFNRDEWHPATMTDFSPAGARLETIRRVETGASILMRLEKYIFACDNLQRCPWPRQVVVAEVKWCLQQDAGSRGRYGLGVRYHTPA
jgi:hypothetical protein